jgi:hypothetical protein
MESQGEFLSSWALSELGAPQRCFSLTEIGRAHLASWERKR